MGRDPLGAEECPSGPAVSAEAVTGARPDDRIFVIEGGVVSESGTYDELMARGGHFAAMARRQLV